MKYRIESLHGTNEWGPAQMPDRLHKSPSAAYNLLERSVEEQDGGLIVRAFQTGDVLHVFGRANGFDCAWRITPVIEEAAE